MVVAWWFSGSRFVNDRLAEQLGAVADGPLNTYPVSKPVKCHIADAVKWFATQTR
jgi:hypothetical protein